LISILIALLFIAALFFIFVPLLPPGLFVFAGYIIYAYYTDFQVLNSLILMAVGFFCLLSLFVDNVFTFIGAKIFKASRLSVIGMLIGMVAGFLFGGPFGIIIGVFIGAFLGEFVYSSIVNRSFIVAFGAVAGYFAGVILKFLIIGGLIFYFMVKVLIFNR